MYVVKQWNVACWGQSPSPPYMKCSNTQGWSHVAMDQQHKMYPCMPTVVIPTIEVVCDTDLSYTSVGRSTGVPEVEWTHSHKLNHEWDVQTIHMETKHQGQKYSWPWKLRQNAYENDKTFWKIIKHLKDHKSPMESSTKRPMQPTK